MTAATLPADAEIGRVALRVADVAEVADFYERVVGLERLDDPESASAGSEPSSPGGGSVVLGAGDDPLLVLEAAPDAPLRSAGQAGLYHVAVRVPDRTALGAAIERCRAGPGLDGAADHIASEAIYLSDPAGNGVEIYADRPRSEWAFTDEGVRLDSLPLDLDALAAQSDGAATAPPGTDVGHVHLAVTSVPTARTFYEDALGMNVRQAVDDTAAFLAAGDYHHHVGMNTWERRYEPAGDGLGLAWFEVVVPDDEALENACQRLEEAGAAVDRDRHGPIAVTDPDGIELRLRVDGTIATSTRE